MVYRFLTQNFFKRGVDYGKAIIIFVTMALLIASGLALAQENTGAG